MKNLKITLSAATGLAVVSLWLTSLSPASVAIADCPQGWYWNNATQNCVPPGLPADPPNGCLTADGTHLNGTICAN